MAGASKKPCCICRRWFRPNPRVGARQRACSRPECQAGRRQKTQARWRKRNPDYNAAYRIQKLAAQAPDSEPERRGPPLNKLPWDMAKDQFGAQGADFIAVLGALLLRTAKDQFQAYVVETAMFPDTLPRLREKTRAALPHTDLQTASDAAGVSPTGTSMGAPASP